MHYPPWAPTSLIERLEQLYAEAANYDKWAEEAANDPDVDYCNCHSIMGTKEGWHESAAEARKLAEILQRLITSEDMKSVWDLLRERTMRPPTLRHIDIEPTWLLWDTIARAIKQFPQVLSNTQTPAAKRKGLATTIDLVKDLKEAINQTPNAKAIARQIPSTYLAIQNLEYRAKMGETPSLAELTIPLTLSSDCNEVRDEDSLEETESFIWHKQPLVSRLAYWASVADGMTLVELLDLFEKCLSDEKEVPPEVKQPGRGNSAIRAFLIRRISQFMFWHYKQPFDEAVARIVSIVLDLEIPLTRVDIRPYLSDRREETFE